LNKIKLATLPNVQCNKIQPVCAAGKNTLQAFVTS